MKIETLQKIGIGWGICIIIMLSIFIIIDWYKILK